MEAGSCSRGHKPPNGADEPPWTRDIMKKKSVANKKRRPSTLASATDSAAELRTISDLLASALVGEYPAETALKRYCATLASPFDVQVVMAKFRSKPKALAEAPC